MTENTTADLPAGRELDALVAERIMGWRRCPCGQAGCCYWRVAGCEEVYLPPPSSTDIAAAMLIVEHLHARGDCVSIAWLNGHPPDFQQMRWQVEFRRSHVHAVADTLPLAICRAALKAVEGEKHDG